MLNRDRRALEDMLRASRKIREYAAGLTRESLPAIPMHLDVGLYEIVVLGEATRRLSQELRALIPNCPGAKSSACAAS